jgi:Domain of unknown function (DUF4124)
LVLETITDARSLGVPLVVLFGLSLNASVARADIYTWTDGNGRVNISNLTPPEGAHVTSVVRETPKPLVPMALAVTSAPQQDVQSLNDRVRQLELEVELAKRQTPPTVIYASAPASPPVQYSYAPEPAPAPSYGYGNGYGCDPSWFGCGFGYGYAPYWYPGSVVVVRTPAFHHHRDFGRGKFPMMANPFPGRAGPGPGRSPGPGPRSPGGMGMGASFARR